MKSYYNRIEPVISITFLAKVNFIYNYCATTAGQYYQSFFCQDPVIHHCSVHLDLRGEDNRLGTVILFVVTPVALILYQFVVT
jgi:hypothetical protein